LSDDRSSQGDRILEGSRAETLRATGSRYEPPAAPGHYALREKLGEGGFGEVWAADQTAPVKRRVAVKVLKAGMDTRAVLARFEAERQALALMDHPNIAKVLDAGETELGRPFFVMDLIQGESITQYCDRQRASTEERLGLFVQVCQAIQHAHTKGVIHRDVKPSNVLVSNVDGKPVPKVIDFGIAKATGQALTEKTLYTAQGQVIGTPAYMSPEQAEMTGVNVDTRTDVYSLGVLLYELLTGTLPFESSMLAEAGLDAMRRIIREQEPPKPSTRISSLGEGSVAAATRRGTSLSRLMKIVRGELDWITMRALEKDPTRRYQSASAIAEDLQRYRRGEAILAGPPSAAYQLRKLVTRHKGPFAFATTVALLLVAFGISMSVLRNTADEARAQAQARADELELVTEFQGSMLSEIDVEEMGRALYADLTDRVRESFEARGASPEEIDSTTATLEQTLSQANATDVALRLLDEQVLGRAVETIEVQFPERPLVGAVLQESVADTYKQMGLYPRALTLMESAVATHRRLLGDEHPQTLNVVQKLGNLLELMGRFDEALRYCREALEKSRRVLGDDHSSTLVAVGSMGNLLYSMGRLEEAESYYREALEGTRRVLGDDSEQTVAAVNNMAGLLDDLGRQEEALVYYRDALERARRLYGDDHPNTLTLINNVGYTLRSMGKPEEALPYYRECLEGLRRVLGDRHPTTLRSINNMAVLLQSLGRLDEARAFQEDALEGHREVLGDDHPETLRSIANLGTLLEAQGRLDEAVRHLRKSLEGCRRVLGDDHPQTLSVMKNLGYLLRLEGQLEESELHYRKSFEGRRRALGADHPDTLETAYGLSRVLGRQGRPAEALDYLRLAVDGGYSNPSLIEEPDLAVLHGDPEFAAIVAVVKRRNDETTAERASEAP
jgi:serine/threonine protein kinase/tetratricopeptide (TPR) repeat protein